MIERTESQESTDLRPCCWVDDGMDGKEYSMIGELPGLEALLLSIDCDNCRCSSSFLML